jgi:8-oxo-dGTP pyrophosphatase MutT (NUDIX family)
MAAPARPASTVVLVRPSARRFEVLLVRRHGDIAFMGGAHVFPGGRVDALDRIEQPEAICDGVAAAVAGLPGLSPADAVAHFVAATRELLEEAGVLLAAPVDTRRLPELRREVNAGTLSMDALARREGLRLSLDRLVPFAHWVTPEFETRRFDTRFFVAMLPDAQEAAHDERETIESEWLDPDDAVERCRRGEIALPPPTWTTLRTLARWHSADAVIASARARRIVTVQPGFVSDDRGTILTLPGDPLFPAPEGYEVPSETRFILVDGRWRPAS